MTSEKVMTIYYYTRISEYLWVLIVIMLLGANPPGNQVILDSVRQCEIVISAGCDISVLHQGVV